MARNMATHVAKMLWLILSSLFYLGALTLARLLYIFDVYHPRGELYIYGSSILWNATTKQSLAAVALVALISGIGASLALCSKRYSQGGYVFLGMMLFLSALIMTAGTPVLTRILNVASQGTVRASAEIEFVQSDLTIRGELGCYGGYFESENGATQCYICSSVDNYGPFSYRPFAEIMGEDDYFVTTQDGRFLSITEREYDDGCWVSVKQYRTAEAMKTKIDHLDEMGKFAAQADYENHRGDVQDKSWVFREMADQLEGVIIE